MKPPQADQALDCCPHREAALLPRRPGVERVVRVSGTESYEFLINQQQTSETSISPMGASTS